MTVQEVTLQDPFKDVKALAFDLMGTCVDWKTSIVRALEDWCPATKMDRAEMAASWRQGFFDAILDSFKKGEQSPDIDKVHRSVLDDLLARRGLGPAEIDERTRNLLVAAWHRQLAWTDVHPALVELKRTFDIVVLANGSTRLQIDIISSADLPFHTLFSSQLLGLTKPDPLVYKRCLDLLDRKSHEVAMVAAHAYDLRAAAKVGMRTIYVHRHTEDLDEDMERVRSEVDLFIDGPGFEAIVSALASSAESRK